jgi:hypothetical protein
MSSWVVSSNPVDAAEAVMGKVVEILRRTDSIEGLVILEQYTIQPERHELFNMPVLVPKRREEAVFLLLKPKVSMLSTFCYASNHFYQSRTFDSPSMHNMTAHPGHANHPASGQSSRSTRKLNSRSVSSNTTHL